MILNWSSSFKRAFKKTIQKNPSQKEKFISTISLLQDDPFNQALKTHKLKGVLEGSFACSIDHDKRIIFDLVKNPSTGETEILLINIGSHDEVY